MKHAPIPEEAAFRQEVEAFLKAAKMSASAFGREALKDANFVFDLRSGRRSPTIRVVSRIRAFMAANPPQEDTAA